MYMKKMMSIGAASNGYIVECHASIKPEKQKESKAVCDCYPGSSEKQYVAATADEAVALITKLMPLLDETYSSEEEFDSAFDKAAK